MGNYLAGISQHDRAHRDIKINKRAGSNEHVIIDVHLANHDRMSTYPDAIANDWGTYSFSSTLGPDSDPVTDVDIGAYRCIWTDDDTPKMTQIKSRADSR